MEDKQKTWTNRILEWEKSGLSLKEFCRLKKLSYPAFYYWRKKLKTKTGQFVEIKVHYTLIRNTLPLRNTFYNDLNALKQSLLLGRMIAELVEKLEFGGRPK